MSQTPSLSSFRRIVVKVGSSLLVDAAAGRLKHDWLTCFPPTSRPCTKTLAAATAAENRDVLVVSSGAIALGRAVLKERPARSSSRTARPPRRSARSRCARVVGILGAHARRRRPGAGHARRHRRAPPLSQRPLDHRQAARMARVPVINENDTVATNEIRFGDNDRLAARVATIVRDLWCCCPTSTGSTTSRRARRRRARATWSRALRRRSTPWPAPPARNSRAAAC